MSERQANKVGPLRVRIAELERQLADRDRRLDYLRNLAQDGVLVVDGLQGNRSRVKQALWSRTFEAQAVTTA